MAKRKPARLVFDCQHPWTAAGETYTGHVEIDSPTLKLVRLASHAHAAKAITVGEGLDLSTVQTQAAGEKALAKAMGKHVVEQLPDGTRRGYWTGPWHKGNLAQHELDRRTAKQVEIAVDAEAGKAPDA